MNIRQMVTLIFKHIKRIIATFFIVMAVVAGITLMLKPVYEAKSTVLVKLWKEDESRLVGASNQNLRLTLSQEELINTEIQILTGRELAEKVIGTLKLENVYPDLAKTEAKKSNPMDAAVRLFGKSLKVEGIRKSNVIAVTFQHDDPRIAARAVNLLVDEFKEKHLALHSNPESSFIGTQFTSFETKLKQSERDLQSFQQKNGTFSLEEQRSLLLKQRVDLDTMHKIAENNVSELRKKIASIRAELQHISENHARYTPTDRDRIITDAKSKLMELQLKEQDLRGKYSQNNRLVVKARKEVELVSQFLKEQEEGIASKVKTGNPVYQSMELDLFRAQGELDAQIAKASAVKNQLKQLDQEIAVLDINEIKIQNLKRQIAINEKNYKTYADRQEEVRISEAMNRLKLSNISVIQTAAVPDKPVRPDRKLSIFVGAALGLLSGLTLAYVSETMAQAFSDPESVEKYLDLPVLLTIPHKKV